MRIRLPPDTPVGYRFQPTEEEIINHHLRLKMIGKLPKKDDVIAELDDVYEWDAWDLPEKSKIQSDDQMWWFFCRRDHGGSSSKRSNRRTKSGFWKITGKDRDIKDPKTKQCIGKKKFLVFYIGSAPGLGTHWVIHEYRPLLNNAVPNQRPYVICRLEKKTDEKVVTPGCNEEEPSTSVISKSIIENPETPSAVSKVPIQAELNAKLLSQPLLSPDDGLMKEDIRLIFSGCGNDDGKINLPMEDCYLEQENPFPHKQPSVTCFLENKTNEKAGTPDCDIGEPSSIITSYVKSQAAPTAIPEVHGYAEVDAGSLSQLGLRPDCYFSLDDLRSNLHDDDEKINSLIHEPKLEHRLPHQWPNVICNLENKTIEKACTPSCDIGEPSGNITSDIGNQVAPTAIPEVHCRAEVYAESSSQPIQSPDCYLPAEYFSTHYNCDHNKKQGLYEAGEPEASLEEFADGLIVDPYENCCNRGTLSNLFSAPIQPMSLKRPYLPDALASSGVDAVGVEERVKRPRSLAHEDTLH